MNCSNPLRTLIAGLLLAPLASLGHGQTSSILPAINPLARDQQGLRLYNVTASFGYSNLALPGSSLLPAFAFERLQSDYDGTAAAAFGYNYTANPNTSVSILYSPSYVRRVRFSEIKAFNQSATVSVAHRVAARWDLSLAAVATDSTLDQLLFTPAILSAATTPVATLDDLRNATTAGFYSSDQLASILTGSPFVATPSRSVVYGSSFFSTSVNAGLSYRYSPRLTLTFNGGLIRSQTRNDSQRDLQGQLNYLIPQSTSQQGGGSLSYAIGPRTQIGVQGSSSRVQSSLARYLTTGLGGFINHKLTPHWFAGASAGTGWVTGDRGIGLSAGQRNVGANVQGNLGYTLRDHNFIGSYATTVGDTYGFASQRSESVTGSWQWQPKARSWAFFASSGLQRLTGGVIGDVRYWHANAGLSKALSRQFSVNFAYAYVDRPSSTGLAGGVGQGLSGYSARVTLVWTPQLGEGQRAPAGVGTGPSVGPR